MKNFVFFLLIISTLAFAQKVIDNPEITADEVQEHINFLASDDLQGRFTGTEECYKAGEYIKSEFERYNLQPAFGDSYFQEFPFIEGIELLGENSLILSGNSLKLENDYIPAAFSGSANIKGKLVFAGYGIDAQELNYNDYDGLDVKDKIVVVLRYNPEYDNPHSEFAQHAALRKKAAVAKEKGAAGLILINGPKPAEEDELIEFRYDRASGIKDFPVVHTKRIFIEKLLLEKGISIGDIQDSIASSLKPFKIDLSEFSAEIVTNVQEIKKNGRNVGAFIEGKDPDLKNNYIVIGAHYDHLGFGKYGSLYRGKDKQIHNGADDNASGVAGVLELAEKLSKCENLKRSVLFFTFSGEELGLLGSNYLVENFPVSVENISAMVNMDMIGRMEDSTVTVFGAGTSGLFKTELPKINDKYNLKLALKDDGFSPSDNSSFYAKEIPVLFFFTGTHSDYHRPSDDSELINAAGEAYLLEYIHDIVMWLNNLKEEPDYKFIANSNKGMDAGWKVYVGTIPDYSYSDGFRITGVSEDSPAAKSGIKGGDIMLKFGDKKIMNIYDYVYALQDHVPGDVVEVIVKRGDEELKLEVTLGAR